MALSQSRLENLLAQSPTFLGRVAVTLCTQASNVLVEQGVAEHAARANYAKSVLGNPNFAAQSAATQVAQGTNVKTTITMEDEGVVTSVTDAGLLAQIAADWNKLAGIDQGT